jgi:hypothetical protein
MNGHAINLDHLPLRSADQPDAAGARQDLSLLVELGVAPEQVQEAGAKPREAG